MKPNELTYDKLGVSATKEDVYAAIKNLDKGLFPNAFCKILPDYLANDPEWCTIVHADGAGTKSSLAYLYWKETGDLSVWRGIAQDSIVMNTDDLICAGATGPFLLSSIINRNKHLIPGKVINELVAGAISFIDKMKSHGIEIIYAGGETADVGDVVRTVSVDSTISCRLRRDRVVRNEIRQGDTIVGLASFGQAVYEDEFNSGIGSNGLTAARHQVLYHQYATKYSESFSPESDANIVFSGSKKLTDVVTNSEMNAGQLLLSPTRTYAPLIKLLLEKHFADIHGIIHCSGGGQKKVMHYAKGVHVIKNNLFPLPTVFKLIREESNVDWREMYQVFNMGHRMEIYCDKKIADEIIYAASTFNIEAKVIGYCIASDESKLTINSEFGTFKY